MNYNNVGIIMTNKCNAACEICCFGCNPSNKDVIDESFMIECIKQISEIPEIITVAFSGGEPFLFPDLLLKGVQLAKQHNLHTTVITNGFWGKEYGEDGFEEIAKYLSELELDKMYISTDDYHNKYVSLNVAQNAITLSRAVVKSTQVMVGETKNSLQAHEVIYKMDDRKYLMNFSIYPFLRIGKANELPDNEFYRHYPKKGLFCGYDKIAAIRYDGEVFPCCNQFVFDSVLTLGNIKNTPLKEILKKTKQNALLSILRTKGFDWFVDVAENELEIKLCETYSSACELCHTLFANRSMLDKFVPFVEREYNNMLVNSLLNRRANDEDNKFGSVTDRQM